MKTIMLLMAQYESKAVIQADVVCKDYFPHLTPDKFIRKVSLGEIKLPLLRMESSQKTAKGIHIQDLADYLDMVRASAVKEAAQMSA